MHDVRELPVPKLDALPLGAHRLLALTDERLYEACGVRLAFTGRAGGVSEGAFASLNVGSGVGDDEAAVARNQRIACEAIGASDALLVAPMQVHGTELVLVDNESWARQAPDVATPQADGVVVGVAGVAASIRSADCLVVAVVSPSGRFAIAHAGWRGAIAHIARKAVRALEEGDGFAPRSYNAYIGPHIRQECFEVGPDVAEFFLEEFGESVVENGRFISLSSAVAIDLLEGGLDARRIADCEICTKCESERYYSYRDSGGRCGRQCTIAYREPHRRRLPCDCLPRSGG